MAEAITAAERKPKEVVETQKVSVIARNGLTNSPTPFEEDDVITRIESDQRIIKYIVLTAGSFLVAIILMMCVILLEVREPRLVYPNLTKTSKY